MLDAKLIRADPERIKEGATAKDHDPAGVDRWLGLDEKRRAHVSKVESLKSERNAASKEIGTRMKAGCCRYMSCKSACLAIRITRILNSRYTASFASWRHSSMIRTSLEISYRMKGVRVSGAFL